MSTARWEDLTPDVPIDRVGVRRLRVGFHVQFGNKLLRVDSQAHWEDLNAKVMQAWASLPAAHQIPLPRTDGVKPTDYTTVNCSGACYSTEEEVDE